MNTDQKQNCTNNCHIVLFEPEIPPNTGNIMRLCANTGFELKLIEPLGFSLDEKSLRRAGLDYRDSAQVERFASLQAYLKTTTDRRILALSTKGTTCYSDADFSEDYSLIFGPESRGLPQEFLDSLPESDILRLPMLPESRSLNLSNSVAVVVYESWRQRGFIGSADKR